MFESRRPFGEHSDIDLAIDGGDYLEAVKIVLKSPFRADVVEMKDDGDLITRNIHTYGTRLQPQ